MKPTKLESAYMGRVAELGCIVCHLLDLHDHERPQLHHIREGQGMAQRAPNWLVIPLCLEHHTGPQGVHGDRTYMKILKMDELDLLAEVIGRLNGKP